ncbi:MAG TPA: M3 family metallopeptidase [Dermatophilaceae bacterium]|nr:M3 family metallopeptidase [Dermatophilaceae bacterium]
MTDFDDLTALQYPTAGEGRDAWVTWLHEHCQAKLDQARAVVLELKTSPPGGPDALGVLHRWNEVTIALSGAFSASSGIANIHPDPTVQSVAEAAEQEAQKVDTDLSLDGELYQVFARLDPAGLDAEATRLLQHTLRDFRRAGVDRDEATRTRLREISERLTALTQEFARNIREDVRSIRVPAASLAGLPQDYVESHPADEQGLVTITTDYPDSIPFRTFAHDAAARRELTLASANRAWPANDAILREILQLRGEQARLLGYPSWPDYDTEVKMIGSGAAVAEFVDRIAEVAAAPGQRDLQVLVDRKRRDDPDATYIDASDATYYAEAVRREQYDVDAQQVRRYFDFPKVRDGLLAVTGRLFGLEYQPVDVPTWHPDVTSYDVVADDQRIGRIHLDLHPREGKYKHAAQFDLARGVVGRQLPEGALICNFSRGLMEHDEVVTLFHEFGHLVHHVLGGRQRWIRFSGVATEWDFVEAPSQMLEEWAWDPEVLRSFASDTAGEPIPVALVERMRAGRDFGEGLQARRQMSYAAISYWLHQSPQEDLTEQVRALEQRYSLYRPMDGTHMHASFGHLDGYTSGYYTYMWSLVIAKDLFSAFDPADLFDPTVAGRYRDRILAQGGRRDAAELVRDFLGRPYSFDAFGAWLTGADRR